jgi:hypothetical protein
MPTTEHNALVDLFRDNPNLAARLLGAVFNRDVPPHVAARVADSNLGQLAPVEFHADLVVELLDGAGNVVLAVILEVQREKDPRKKYTWPVYWAVARAQRECPTSVLVLAPDADVAAWAEERTDDAPQVLVLGPRTLPVVADPVAAANEVELAVLSAMVHGNGPAGLSVVPAAFRALGRLDLAHQKVYSLVIWNALREPMRRALEAMAMEHQTLDEATFPPFMQSIFDRGVREGELKGMREGELKGEIKGMRDALLRLITRARLTLTENERQRIAGCTDLALLDRWMGNVLGAKTAAAVFA